MIYKSHAYQKKFHLSNTQVIAYIGGRGSGKSLSGIVEDLWWADNGRCPLCFDNHLVTILRNGYCGVCQKKVTPRPIRGAIVAPTFGDLEGIHVLMINEMVPESSVVHYPTKGAMYYQFTNGSRIDLLSADNPKLTGRGRRYDFLHLDEACYYLHFAQLWATLRPTLTGRDGHVWITTTPLGKDAVYKTFVQPAMYVWKPENQMSLEPQAPHLFINESGNKDITVVTLRTIDNPVMPIADVLRAKETMDERAWRQDYFASIEEFKGLVYPDFSEATHVIQSIPSDVEGLQWFISYDDAYPGRCASVLCAEDSRHNIYVVDEYYELSKTVPEVAQGIRAMIARNGNPYITAWVADTSVKKEMRGIELGQGMSIWDQFRDNGIVFQMANKDIRPGIDRVTQLIKNTVNNPSRAINEKLPAMYVLERCTNFRAEISEYVWSEEIDPTSSALVLPKKVFDHLQDAFRYLVMSRPDWFTRPQRDLYGRVVMDDNNMLKPADYSEF